MSFKTYIEIPSAEEFFQDNCKDEQGNVRPAHEIGIAFTKLHVERSLETAANNADVKIEESYTGSLGNARGELYEKIAYIDRDSIRNAYPEDNIH
jgi:hypothetical protein